MCLRHVRASYSEYKSVSKPQQQLNFSLNFDHCILLVILYCILHSFFVCTYACISIFYCMIQQYEFEGENIMGIYIKKFKPGLHFIPYCAMTIECSQDFLLLRILSIGDILKPLRRCFEHQRKREIMITTKSLFSIFYVLALAIDFGWYWL